MKFKLLFITLLFSCLSWGQLSITSTGTAYTQNFDGMTSSATASLPSGFKMISYSASPDWSSGVSATAQAYGTSGTGVVTGTSAGGLINWANGVTASSTDRAIGFLNSGSSNTNPSHIILKFTNNTGVNITTLNIAFDYEKYRSGSRQCDWAFFHGSSSNPTTPATDGNQTYLADANNTVISNPPSSINKSFTLSSLSIANGGSYYLKWTYTPLNGGSNGQGIAIDNFSITAYSPNPSPATLPYTQNFEGVYNEWNIGSNTPNSWVVGSATNNGGSKALYVTNNGSANSYSDASSGTAQTIASFQVDLSNISNAQLAFDWRAIGEANYDFGDVWINTGGSDILISYMDPIYADSDQFGEFCDNSGTNSSTYSNKVINIGAYVGGVVTIKFRWRCDDTTAANPPFAIDNVSVSAIAPSITPPTVATESIGSITSTSASIGGNVSNQGTNNVTEKGICYSTNTNPTISDNKVTSGSGTGIYNVSLTNLAFQTHYYVRAYAITSAGVYYGDQMDFYTNAISAPVAATASNIAANSFTANWSSVSLATSYKLDVSTSSTTFTNYVPFSQFVTFDFENGNQNTVNSSLSNASNSNTTIWAVGSGTLNYANEIGNGGEVKKVTGWDNGNETKYWRINMSTYGMFNIKVSSKQRSDANGPKNWKLQYSIGQNGSENWIDVSSSAITVADNYTSGVLNQLQLPTEIENLSVVSLRWIMTSNTSVNNGTVSNTGESNIDDILVFGESYQTLVVGYDNLTVNSTSKIITGLNPNSTYYYRVRSIASTSTSNNSNLITVTTLNTTTTWNGTSWSNSTPTASIDAIIDGDLTTAADLVSKDLTINSGKTLTIGAGKKLTVSGNLINNGTIIFKSDVNGTAMFGVFNGSQSGTGVVTVERFIPSGKRAFRLLSPAVTTTGFISGNWQGQTHITGGASGGFDATETNNPSMYTYNNQVASGSGWTPIANTTGTNLTAGVGYRVLVRGDRTPTNITSASADNMNAAITLSATGTLKTGTVTLNSSSTPAINNTLNPTTADYSLVGNPYQSAVDWNAVTKSGIDASYYAWDPNMGTTSQRGRYVSFNGTTNNYVGTPPSQVGQFIQPGQAFFVKNTVSGTAGTLTFDESDKATTSANVFRSANTPTLGVALYYPNELAIGAYPIDAAKAVFSVDYTNELGLGDATKLEAAGENIAWYRNNTKLAIDASAPVTTSDELAMKTLRLGANKNYTFKIETTNFDSALTPYLVDNFLNTQTAISTSEVYLATFSTTSNTASYGEDRFKIVFQNSTLDNDDFANNIKLYPNPAKAGGSFYIDGITEATVSVYNVVGQTIPVTVMSQGNAVQVTPKTALSQGVYLVTVTTAGKTAQVKWIVE